MAAAAAVGDLAAELGAIRARVAALSAPQRRAERLRLGTRAVELAAPAGQPLAAVLGRVWRIDAACQLLNLEAVDARAIATQLVLSGRTVEGHVRSILAKRQLTNRTELAAWTLRNPGP